LWGGIGRKKSEIKGGGNSTDCGEFEKQRKIIIPKKHLKDGLAKEKAITGVKGMGSGKLRSPCPPSNPPP